ncbi:MAG: energy transducer TonB [Blastocatellia bacterium]
MKSIGRRLLSFVCAWALVANSVAGAMAQDRKSEVFNGGFANAAQQSGDAFQFFSQEMSFDNRLVKGAPFSADIVSETIQTLPDGNRIVQRSEGRIYRDSQGRTRNERTYQMGGSSEQRQVINIIDPVTNAGYSLDPETRIARKNTHYFGLGVPTSDLFLTPPFNPDAPSHQPRGVSVGVPGSVSKGVAQGEALVKVHPIYPPLLGKAINASGPVGVEVIVGENGRVISAKAISGHPVLRSVAEDAARKWVFRPTEVGGKPVQVQSILDFVFTAPSPPTYVPPTAATSAETPKKIKVLGGVSPSEAIIKVQPVYPAIAKAAGASGDVQVEILISETGEVIHAKAISGHHLLRSVAEDAARRWVFKPTELEGKPVEHQGILTFKFVPPSPPTFVSPAVATSAETTRKTNVSGVAPPAAAIIKVPPVYPAIAKQIGASGDVQVEILISDTGEVIEAKAISGHPVLRSAAEEAARKWMFKPTELEGKPVKHLGILTFKFVAPKNEEPAPPLVARRDPKYTTNTEQLGKQTIEGVECAVTRAVTTMPAGAIGNELPIKTVNETWYAPELQMIIMSKRGDPRFGESTYRVTNINRSEPDAALFQVPSEYTIIDSRSKKVEVDVKEFEEMRRKLKERVEGARKPNDQ